VSTTIPKRVFTLEEVKPGEKIWEVCIILKDTKGALAKVANVLTEANVNIKTSSLFYLPSRSGIGSWTSFVDVSRATRNVSELERKLRSFGVVEDVRFEEPKPAPFESLHFPLLHGETRAVIIPIGMFWAMWSNFEKILAPSGLAAVLYNAGKRVGEYVATRLSELYNVKGADIALVANQAGKATGWGIIEVSSLNSQNLTGTVVVRDCFEAAAWRKKHEKACNWTRGYIAGVMTKVFGKPVEAVEVECAAAGDEHCQFEIRTKI